MKKFFKTTFKIIIFFIGWAVLSGIVDVPSSIPAVWRFFAELIPLIFMLIFTIVFMLFEKMSIKILFTENIAKGILTGTAVGFLWIGIPTAILIISKQLIVIEKNTISFLLIWIASAFINVVMQELLVRGYIYQLLKKDYNIFVAVLVSTVLFTAMHLGAFEAGIIPVVNVITMCLFTTVLYETERTLLAPIMAHAVWNIIGAIFLGCVNLAEDYPHMFTLISSQNILLSGGEYKIEASIIVTIINIVLTVLFLIKLKLLSRYNKNWKEVKYVYYKILGRLYRWF